MQLLDLHDDALWHIIETLPDFDLISLAFSCKRLTYLTSYARRKRKLASKYSVIDINDSNPHVPIDIISTQPLISKFVTTIKFNPGCSECYEEVKPPSSTEQDFVDTVISKCNFLSEHDRQAWAYDARKGYPNAILLVILVWCRYTTTLILDSPSGNFTTAIRYLFTKWVEFKGAAACNDFTLPRIVHLEVDRLHDYVCPHYFCFNDIVDLVCLPHLRSCHGREIYGKLIDTPLFSHDVSEENYNLISLNPCKVKYVTLYGVTVPPEELHDIVTNMPELVQLCFHDHHDFIAFDDDQSSGMVNYLEALAKQLQKSGRSDLTIMIEVDHLCIVRKSAPALLSDTNAVVGSTEH